MSKHIYKSIKKYTHQNKYIYIQLSITFNHNQYNLDCLPISLAIPDVNLYIIVNVLFIRRRESFVAGTVLVWLT